LSEFESEDTPLGIGNSARLTPVDAVGRTELAAMAAGLNLDTISQADDRILAGALAAAQTGLAAPVASLQFLGIDQIWYLGGAAEREDVHAFAGGVTRAVLHADGHLEVNDLEKHPSFSNAKVVRSGPNLRWMVAVPIRGYNSLVIGALTLFDVNPRMPLSDTDQATLRNLISVIEAALESHRARVAARAQRELLVKRLRDAHRDFTPHGTERRRTIHDLKNALTVIRLNSQAMEESGEFDAEALADIRGSLQQADDVAQQLNHKVSTPVPPHRPTWSTICESQRQRIEHLPHHPNRTVKVVDESPNLTRAGVPDCLGDVTNLLVDRALELSHEGAELAISLRVFPHFARFSVWVPMQRTLDETSSPFEPVLVHPARNALLAVGGSITSSGTETMHRLSAWFPLDDEATYVI
jgi:GAF domain-containing protein